MLPEVQGGIVFGSHIRDRMRHVEFSFSALFSFLFCFVLIFTFTSNRLIPSIGLLSIMVASSTYLVLLAAASSALADGIGLIGFGKTMYEPPCAFACRSVIARSRLQCTPQHDADSESGGHAPAKTPESCFISDPPFMQTLALCIDTYCPGSDAPRAGVIEEYWGSHLATGSIGNFSWVPKMTYQEALQRAKRNEHDGAPATNSTEQHHGHGAHTRRAILIRHGGHGDEEEEDHNEMPPNTTLPIAKPGAPLNVTSFVRLSDWQKNYNGLKSFELNERGHAKYT